MTNLKIRNFALIILSMLTISAIVFSTTAIRTAQAQAVPTGMFCVPQDTVLYNPPLGTAFSVNVTIANVTGIAGVEFQMTWNASLLNCTGMGENLYATVTPIASIDNIWKIKNQINNTEGLAYYAYTYQDLVLAQTDGYAPINVTLDAYPNGLATAILNFTVTLVPPVNSFYECDFNFTEVKVGDLNGDNLNATGTNGHYRIYGPPETTETVVNYNGVNYTVTTVTNASFVPGSMTFVKVNDTSYHLAFNLVGTPGDMAYVNATVPKALMDIGTGDSWIFAINGAQTAPVITSDGNNTYFYATTTLTTSELVDIFGTIPEYTLLFIPLLMAATLVAFALRRRKL